MNTALHDLMQGAARLTREGRLQEATQALQRALGIDGTAAAFPMPGQFPGMPGMPGMAGAPAGPATPARPDASGEPAPRAGMPRQGMVLDGYVTEVQDSQSTPSDAAPRATHEATGAASPSPASFSDTGTGTDPGAAPVERFLAGSFSHGGRTVSYKLFVPAGAAAAPRPLVLMLHGCTQNPDDFAAGTGMNALAREAGALVLYPAQAQDANPQRCWNWFKHTHQQRGRGEPALLAALARSVAQQYGADPERIYVAGLSAGGAMAAILAQAYPDVFAAAGVHSGLAQGTARDAMSALNAMRSGQGPAAAPATAGRGAPTIVFHGDADSTVHPGHGAHVLAAALPPGTAAPAVSQGRSPKGRAWTRNVHAAPDGRVLAEHWRLHGTGHAWSGGQAAGSYTDPSGPDASREMLRFFLAHGRRSPA